MAYNEFTHAKPVGTDTGPQAIDYIRNNEMALRDAIIWDYGWPGVTETQSGGTPEQPAVILMSLGTERWKKSITWGTTGGEAGNITKITYEYSSNSGSNYDPRLPFKNRNVSYDSSGNRIGVTWDNS